MENRGSTSILFCNIYEPIKHTNIKFYGNVTPYPQNPNNFILPGKKVRFKAEVQNNTSTNLLTLSGKISTTNPYVTITNSEGIFNNISKNEVGWLANEFEIELSNDLPNNELINFDLTLNDQIIANGPWYTSFSIPVILNPFSISNNIIDDDNIPDSDGNNNDVVEPNETIEIIPLLKNSSSNSFSNIQGYLFSKYPEINIWNNIQGSTEMVLNYQSYGDVLPNSNNVMPAKDFVFKNNFDSIYNLPFNMVFAGFVSNFNGSQKYKNIELRWPADFMMNEGKPNPPITSLPEFSEEIVRVFPNPSNGVFSLATAKHSITNINVKDIFGQVVWSSQINNNSNVFTLDLSELTSGLYFLHLQSSNKNSIIQKILITK